MFLPQVFAHQPYHFSGLCMPVSLQLGIDQVFIEAEFEATAVRRDQRDRFDLGLELPKQVDR